MTNCDAIVANYDLLDEQSHDTLAVANVQGLDIGTQAGEEFCERLCQSQVSHLVSELRTQRLKFYAQALLSTAQFRHASAQFVQREQFLLIGRDQPLHTLLHSREISCETVLVAFGRIRTARRFKAAVKFSLNERGVLQ